jgi:Cu(I)/Ag(I) efflux system membrane fusion protein
MQMVQKMLFISLILIFLSCDRIGKENAEEHDSSPISQLSGSDTVREAIYWCPMDTQIIQKTPGTCPICGMRLEPKPESPTSSSEGNWIYRPVNESVLSRIKSIRPVEKTVRISVNVTGYVSYDERRMRTISARVSGRIEKLRIRYKYQPVKKGQAMLDIYSHELQAAQQEYFFIKNNDPDAVDLIAAARKKLVLIGMSETQIEGGIRHGDHRQATSTIYSPYDGFILEKQILNDAMVSGSSDPMEGNSGMANTPGMKEKNKEISLREGAYVNKGESIFRVVNTDVVWGIFEVHSGQLGQLKPQQTIHIIPEYTGEKITGKIDLIEPAYTENAGTIRLRVYLENKNNNLKIGSLLSGEIEAGEKRGLWIPSTSVYDLGVDKIVFAKRVNRFETKKIMTGISAGNEVEVINGLSADEEIAENAQFLIDSESFVKIK